MRITIEAELILACEDMLVQKGDSLLIYNGVCVGVKTADSPEPPGPLPPSPPLDREHFIREIPHLLAGRGPLSAVAIGKALGVSTNAYGLRAEVSNALRQLAYEGKVQGLIDEGKTRVSRWTLPGTSAASKKGEHS